MLLDRILPQLIHWKVVNSFHAFDFIKTEFTITRFRHILIYNGPPWNISTPFKSQEESWSANCRRLSHDELYLWSKLMKRAFTVRLFFQILHIYAFLYTLCMSIMIDQSLNDFCAKSEYLTRTIVCIWKCWFYHWYERLIYQRYLIHSSNYHPCAHQVWWKGYARWVFVYSTNLSWQAWSAPVCMCYVFSHRHRWKAGSCLGAENYAHKYFGKDITFCVWTTGLI